MPENGPALRVLAQSAYPLSAPGPRVRVASFAPLLREHGVEFDFRPAMSDAAYALISSAAPAPRKAAALAAGTARALLARPPAHDLLLVHRLRLLTPFPGYDPPRRLGVYDLDDALFVESPSAANRRFGWAKREAERCVECMRRARLVLAGNSYLAAEARRHARRVEVVPTCVDPERQPLREHRERDPVTVGWIGSRTTSAYLEAVLPAFARLNRDRLRARLVLVGADPALRAPWIEHRRWSLDSERDDLASFDLGIMPLPDSEWARGKCGYKALQYFSAGVPAIAAPVGVARELVGEDGERGALATSPEEWHAALERLAGDAGQRARMGAAARELAGRDYSYRRWAPQLAELLRSVA